MNGESWKFVSPGLVLNRVTAPPLLLRDGVGECETQTRSALLTVAYKRFEEGIANVLRHTWARVSDFEAILSCEVAINTTTSREPRVRWADWHTLRRRL